jgi:hypothetical protein
MRRENPGHRLQTSAAGDSNGWDGEYGVALALTFIGDSRSQKCMNDLEKRLPEDTFVQFSYLPVPRGLDALNRGDPSRPIDVLQVAAIWLGRLRWFHRILWAPLPRVCSRHGLFELNQGVKAADEFRKIIENRGIVFNDPIGALARLQLGRALVLAGDSIKARGAYQEFLTLWKDADPDIPVFKHAKPEFAKLSFHAPSPR